MDIYAQIVTRIIEQQETIIGPVAVEQAEQVPGLNVDWSKHTVSIAGKDERNTVDELVAQYEALFGPVAVEVSKEATARLTAQLKPEQLPKSLQ